MELDETNYDADAVKIQRKYPDPIGDNMENYERATSKMRPGNVIERFEEVIDAQRADLLALAQQLNAIRQRSSELTKRLTVLHQSVHNAIYSNLNGIDHPVVKDILTSDIQSILLGHSPSELLDQEILLQLTPP
jgi:hypothetical protein